MSIVRTVVINPVEPALLSMRSPLGIDLDLSIFFKAQDGSAVDPDSLIPQLAFRPRSQAQVFAYDIETASSEQGLGTLMVPGSALTDPLGFTLELYKRRPADYAENPPVPSGLIAKGLLATEGAAYAKPTVLSPAAIPVIIGPPGPAGPAGPTGQRGSIWTTGNGDPNVTGSEIDGDMYLNNLNGDVWRFSGTTGTWMIGTF